MEQPARRLAGARPAPQAVPHPADQARQGTQTLVWECLQRLDADDRDLLCASYYDDLSDQAIGATYYADGTDTARGLRVWRRRQKAQARLRDLLLEAGHEPAPFDLLNSQAL